MKSNFHFLESEWAEICRNAMEAERHALTAPVTSAIYSRLTMELLVNWLYDHDEDYQRPYQPSLAALMTEPCFVADMPPGILNDLDYIRKQGNTAVHTGKASAYHSMAALKYLHRFCQWVVRVYSSDELGFTAFDETLIPATGAAEKSLAQLRRLQEQLDGQLAEVKKERERRLEAEAELEKYKAELAALSRIKQQNKAVPLPPEPFSEAETRRLFIDVMLREAGWDPQGPKVPEYRLEGMPATISPSGRGKADYVLWGDDGLPLAVVEAKRTSREPYQGQHQAEAYADCLERMHGQRPVIFFTNGFQAWIWDDQFYPPREVQGFYTRDELQLLINRRRTRQDIRNYKASKDIAGRHYQIEAVQRVAEAFADDMEGRLRGKKQAALIVMATGAGKTRTSAAIVDMLFKNNWAKRVLFLADRNALVSQAQNAYKKLLPHLSSIDLTREKEDDTTRLVFSTYPTMMNRIDSARSGDERFYGVGHFDLIIVDEAHRSVYQKYRAIFDYFDALLLGMTATPRDEADRDTYELFQCDLHNPTAYYELDQAVADKFLVPPRGKEINLGFLRRGIKYSELPEAEKAQYEATFRDEEGKVPEEIGAAAINEWLFNSDTIDKVLDYLMTEGLKVEGGDKVGKSIIFARNHDHALEIQKRFDIQYPRYAGKFCQVVDNRTSHVEQVIDDFKQAGKLPQIAVSVDMLDTGIDVAEIVNLVFFKPVYSAAKFWQMIGRGTRLCPELFGPEADKQYFCLFDFCGNFEFFDFNPEGLSGNVPPSLSQRLFEARLHLALQIRALGLEEFDDYRHELLDWCHGEVERLFAQRDNFRVRQALAYIDKYRGRNRWSLMGHQEAAEVLQYLAPLVNVEETDEQAKRFDLLLLQIETAKVERNAALQAGVGRLSNIARRLQAMSNIPAVREKLPLIRQVQQGGFWKSAGMMDMEHIRLQLRHLIRLIPKKDRKIYKTNFADNIEAIREIEVLKPYTRMESYRERVERFVRENRNHLAIQKLRNNQPLTQGELEALEQILFDGQHLGSREDYQREYGQKPLGKFIRSIVGLEAAAAKAAFADFLNRGKLTADQMSFINNIIDFLANNGVIEKQRLVQPPFSDLHHLGIFGLFDEQEQVQIVNIIDRINRNAEVG